MKLTVFNFFALSAIFFAAPFFAKAAPDVSSIVLPSYSQNAVIEVNGTGFGIKSTPNPYVWDRLERATISSVADIGTWGSTNVLNISGAQKRDQFSNYAAHYNFTADGTAGFKCGNTTLSRKWFVQYWVYLDPNFDWGTSTYGNGDQMLSNVKFLRFWNPGSTTENFYTQFWWGLNGGAYSSPENVAGQTTKNYNNFSFSKSSLTKGQWHLLQFEFADSSAASVADGEFRTWFDGHQVENRTGFVGNTTGLLKRPFFIGFYNAWGQPVNSAPNDYYLDDVYVDTTWQRIEIGDNAVYANCTHRETQIPTLWNDGQIQFNLNFGSFTTEPLYLFVIDENGVASSGYPINSGDTVAPAAPSGLSVE